MGRPKILYAPVSAHTERVFRPETFARFQRRFEVTLNEGERNWTSEELAERIAGFEGLVTGWGTPPLTEEVWEKADRLRIVAHSAGSVKYLFPGDTLNEYVRPRGIVIFSANAAIALNVAEATIGLMIAVSRHWYNFWHAVRTQGAWRHPTIPRNGQFLRGSTVGIIGASKVGREVIRLLRPFDVRILVYDPYLSEWEAGRLGVEKADLETLMSTCDIISFHHPTTPETDRLVGADLLAKIKEGALLINTARPRIFDPEAFLAEARKGRFLIALDVTEPEPLPPDHPLRRLPNVYITPHCAGAGFYGYHRIGESTLQALEDFFAERPVEGAVNLDLWDTLA